MNLLPLVVMMSSLAIESTEMNPQGIKVILKNHSEKSVKAFRINQTEQSATSMELIGELKSGETYNLQFHDPSIKPKVVGVIYSDGTYEGPEVSVLLARRKAARKQTGEQYYRSMQSRDKQELGQSCMPQTRVASEQFVGCDNLLKNQVTQVSFDNGYTKIVSQTGTGQCARDTTCNWWEIPSTVQCWPTFTEVRRDGYWEQTVVDSRIVIDYNVSCPGDDGTAILLPGAQCAPSGDARTEEVRTSCYVGGYPGDFNPFPEPECSWSFLPGIPYCGDYEPVNK